MTRCGVDIVKVARIKEAIEKHGGSFLRKVFTEVEIAYCESKKRKFEHLAARFAAKEAFYKALSPQEVRLRFHDLEVRNQPNGAPQLIIAPEERRRLLLDEGVRISLSLSHDTEYAVAMVLLND